jgi:GTP pyrophosphokinase
VNYDQIYDVRATRIIVPQVRDCYAALGVVHSLWQYIPGEFDDYIATPKANHYRSLHTAVIGPGGKTVEVQIRTNEMHQHSEFGVAAHWRYKEGKKQDGGFDKKIAWLRSLLEWKDEVRDASEFVEKFKNDIFQDRLYVFTPKGHVVDLPQGATPLDFAYHIHTEVGHSCRGAKVNGRMVPLTYQLNTGEQVEVLTVKSGEPSRDWLNPHLGYLKSSKSKSRVQSWFKQQNFENNVAAGRNTLEREIRRLGYRDIAYETLVNHFKFPSQDDFLAAIGRNDLKITSVVSYIQQSLVQVEGEPEIVPHRRRRARPSQTHDDIRIRGVGNLLTNFAQCCKPVPGDSITGFITVGRGVSIHRSDCRNVLRFKHEMPERLIDVDWGQDTEQTYPVSLIINAYDRHGLLRDISSILANEAVNVSAVNTASDKADNVARMVLTVEIGDIQKLSRILARINQLPNVIEARRDTG